MKVFEDYSVKLILPEVNFSAQSHDRVAKMQLLERNDGRKWFLWIAQGKLGRDKVSTQVQDHFNKNDAIADFEKRFQTRTENRWGDRDAFQEHPGKYILVVAERELQKVHNALSAEEELTTALTKALSSASFEKASDQDIFRLLAFVWNLKQMKRTMADFKLDIAKLPLGLLDLQKVRKSHAFLLEIQKLLHKEGTGNLKQASMDKMTELVTDYYKALPHDFGTKKPETFFNLLRIKEETRKLEAIADIQIAEQALLHCSVSLNRALLCSMT